MNVLDPHGTMPLYHQLAGVLRQKINSGEYPVGSMLPSEAQLVDIYGISRVTVRQAVGVLVTEGLVTRASGRGTRVESAGGAPAGQNFNGSLSELIYETSRSQVQQIQLQKVPTPARIASLLNIEDAAIYRLSRVRLLDDNVFAYSVDYIPEQLGATIEIKTLEKVSLMSLLAGHGVDMARARQSIRADIADVELAAQLDLNPGDPVLAVDRVVFDSADVPIFYVETRYRGDRYTYTVDLGFQNTTAGPLHSQFA